MRSFPQAFFRLSLYYFISTFSLIIITFSGKKFHKFSGSDRHACHRILRCHGIDPGSWLRSDPPVREAGIRLRSERFLGLQYQLPVPGESSPVRCEPLPRSVVVGSRSASSVSSEDTVTVFGRPVTRLRPRTSMVVYFCSAV